jgi:hypothetical protein
LGGYYYPQQAVGYAKGGGFTQGGQILAPPTDYQVPAQGYAAPQEYAGDHTRLSIPENVTVSKNRGRRGNLIVMPILDGALT